MDIAETIKDAPTDVLCNAANTLQKAHDYVEANEFDVNTYGREEDATCCCYIGSVHIAADEQVDYAYSRAGEPSRLALLMLDLAAINAGADPNDNEAYEEDVDDDRYYEDGEHAAGTIAEHWGMNLVTRGENPVEQKPIALGVYRDALRMVHTELMRREAIPA